MNTKQPLIFCVLDYSTTDGASVLSIHETKEGAYKAMRAELERQYKDWYDERIIYGKGGWAEWQPWKHNTLIIRSYFLQK